MRNKWASPGDAGRETFVSTGHPILRAARCGLALALITAAGCVEPLAERCYIDRDCPGEAVCSNGGDRASQGFCVPEPDAGPADAGGGS